MNFTTFEEFQAQIWAEGVRFYHETRAEHLFAQGWAVSMVKNSVPALSTDELKRIRDAVKERTAPGEGFPR